MKNLTMLNLWDLVSSFPSEEECRKRLELLRWKGHITCVYCDSERITSLPKYKRYQCNGCTKQFSLFKGTIFDNTKIPLQKWFLCLQLCVNQKKGISSHQLGRSLGIAQPNALYVLRRIRKAMRNTPEFRGKMSSMVEVDESYFGGKAYWKHRDKRIKGTQGRSLKVKHCAFGILERGGNVKIYHVKQLRGRALKAIIRSRVTKSAMVSTDEFSGYRGLSKTVQHGVVFHKRGQYVNGDFHSNTIEGFWSQFKRSVYGIYHSTSKDHFSTYCNEAEYKYNTRKMTDAERFDHVLSHCILPLEKEEKLG